MIAFGDRAGVSAHEFLRGIPVRAAIQRLWVLSPARLLVLDAPVPPPEPAPAPEPEKSLLGKAVGFGRGVAKFGKEVAEIFTDRTRTYGQNREGEPIGLREFALVAELPGARIGRVDRAKRSRKPVLRVSLVDGSGFDFLEERIGWTSRSGPPRRTTKSSSASSAGTGCAPAKCCGWAARRTTRTSGCGSAASGTRRTCPSARCRR